MVCMRDVVVSFENRFENRHEISSMIMKKFLSIHPYNGKTFQIALYHCVAIIVYIYGKLSEQKENSFRYMRNLGFIFYFGVPFSLLLETNVIKLVPLMEIVVEECEDFFKKKTFFKCN